jgi:Surface antigen variable number repeat
MTAQGHEIGRRRRQTMTMRYRLRTLLILMALLPPLLAVCYLLLAPSPKRRNPQEGHWIYDARILGNRLFSEKKLLKVIGLPISNGIKGWRLNADSAEDSRQKIEHLYHQAGYLQAVVSLRSGGKRGDLELIFEIREGNQVARILDAP